MKLINRISRRYIIVSLLLYVISLFVLILALNHLVNEDIEEKLSMQEERIYRLIRNGVNIPDIYPRLDIDHCKKLKEEYFSDTMMYDPTEGEVEAFKSLVKYRKIHNKNYRIIIRESRIDSEDYALILFGVTAGLLLLNLISLFFINKRTNSLIFHPFFDNLNRIKNFKLSHNEPLTLLESNVHEFKELNFVIQKFTNKIIFDYDSLKQFTENAAHELQTPLTLMKSKLEVLLNQEDLNEKEAQILLALNEDISRLSRLNKNLNLLTKIENQQFTDLEKVNINQIVFSCIQNSEELTKLKKIEIITNVDVVIEKKISLTLAEILIGNLLSNAIKHNTEGGLIEITTSTNTLRISNSGMTAIIEPDRIFDRFYKGDPSSKSIGLGMAIIKLICNYYNILISYTFADSKHSFQLKF